MNHVASRRARDARGRFAETLAAWRLRLFGYRVIARRARTPFGEIDLVAVKGPVAAMVEVKARKDLATGIVAVSPRQQRRIATAAVWLASNRPDLAGRRLRFDIVIVRPWRAPQHIPDAWRPH